MPELPEVEHLRRTLAPHVLGRRVERALLRRPSVLEAAEGLDLSCLESRRIVGLLRHGKQLLLTTDGPALTVHLGMTGTLLVTGPETPARPHLHAMFVLGEMRRPRRAACELRFHDPRRFGWLTLHASEALARTACWTALGPDALTIEEWIFIQRVGASRSAVKAILLDQRIVAGMGNIYVDEALHRAGIHPRQPGGSLQGAELQRLHASCRTMLEAAIAAGGSTIRDYVDACGLTGAFAAQHAVYGRSGEPCRMCGVRLRGSTVAGRSTVWCPRCQPLRRRRQTRLRDRL